MKKMNRFFMAVLSVAAVAVSCQKPEFEETMQLSQVDMEFAAVTESAPTKMTLGESLKPEWETTDRLAVWDANALNEFTISESEGSVATFRGKVTEGSTEFHALFPYADGISFDNASKAFTAVIPAEQVISAGDSVATSALMGMAYAEKPAEGNPQFAFKNVCGLIKVVVPTGERITSIVITSNGEEKFVGEGTVKMVDEVPVFSPSQNAMNSVTLLPEGEDAAFAAGSYYAAVAPVKFESGFTVYLVRADGAAGVIGTDKTMEVVRNGGTNLKDVVSISEWTIAISTKEQLFAWGKNWGTTDKVTLLADIDMENEPWTPIGNASKTFNGVFDGNGKKIYNLNVNSNTYAGFIGHLSGQGVVKNLTIGSSDGLSYDNSSDIVHTPSKNATGWSYVGAVAKLSSHASLENVTNFARLEIPDTDFTPQACMGGMTGINQGHGNITGCKNYGDISYLETQGVTKDGKIHIVAGIVAKCDYAVTVSGCYNYGKITNKCEAVRYVGGIIGNSRSSNYDNTKPVVISECGNAGAIEINASPYLDNEVLVEFGIGGICGMLQNANLERCTNTGKITVATTSSTNIYVGGIAGMRRGSYDTSMTGCINGTEGMKSSLFDFQTTAGDCKFGGVLGHCHKSSGALNIINCTNNSPITLSNAGGIFQVGGISGAIVENVLLTATGCVNNGAMTFTSESTTGQKIYGGLFGYVRSVADADFLITDCVNNANMTTSAGGTEYETDIAGIVGYAGAYLTFENCKNYGAISTSGSATKPRPAGIAAVASGTATKFVSCENWGKVSNASSHGNLYIGGLVAFSNSVTLDGCSNNGEVSVTNAGGEVKLGGLIGQAEKVTVKNSYNKNKVSFSANRQPRVGGIVGNITQDVTIENCHNQDKGTISCSNVGGTACVGGIVARIGGSTDNKNSQNISIKESSNKCAITINSSSGQSWIVGGVVGVAEHGNATATQNQIYKCKNGGSITFKSTATTGGKYARAAGILAQASDVTNTLISECENTGAITVTTATPSGTHAAGIIGYDRVNVGLSNNVNKGAISATGSNSGVYVGGIWAYDDTAGSGHTAKDVTGNVNYGAVSGSCGSGKVLAVGGLFGIVRKTAVANLKSDNVNYGNVLSAGGALAGASEIASWSGKVGKNVVVNGVEWSEGVAATWLCPSAKNALSATYVDAPAE